MKKAVSLLLLAVLLLGLFAGCKEEKGLPLSAEREQEIKDAFIALYFSDSSKREEYGVDQWPLVVRWRSGDKIALYFSEGGGMMAYRRIYFGKDLIFEFPDSETLYIYNNGNFWDLQAAYDNGILSKDELRSLHKDHIYVHPRHFPDPEAAAKQMVVYVPASVKVLLISFRIAIAACGCVIAWSVAKRRRLERIAE